MSKSGLKLKPLSEEDNTFLDSLLDELGAVPNPKWVKLKLRYLFMGLEGYRPDVDGAVVKKLLPYAPVDFETAEKVKYINAALRSARKISSPKLIAQIMEALELRRRRLSANKRKELMDEIKVLDTLTFRLQKALVAPALKSFFENYIEEGHYDDPTYPYRARYLTSKEAVAQLQVLCHLAKERNYKGSGRPSMGELVAYVVEVAKVYKILSKGDFKVLRHFDDTKDNQAVAVTPGHRFVEKVLIWTERQDFDEQSKTGLFTKANIYNACEKAQKILAQN